MMKLKIYPYDLQLKHTFKIAHDQRDVQKSVIVALSDGTYTGYGEATANKFYGVSQEQIINSIENIEEKLAKVEDLSPALFHQQISQWLDGQSFPICALDEAYLDFYGKKHQKKTYQLWGLELNQLPLSNYTIGIGSIDEMVSKMKEVPNPIYKIKLGTKEDIEIVRALREHTDAIFRVDANCAWSVEESIENSKVLKDLGVELIEQPMHPSNVEGMREVYQHSHLPLLADESCIVESDVEKCVGQFHAINIKLTKCGGPTVALRMIEKARQLGLKVMVGCMTESSVGISAIAQLLPLLDYVDMDGALLLKNDPAKGVSVMDGKVHFPEVFGNGVELELN
ncbi:dipeptide epimerase [Sediminitomix flava]|uniref:Dipeptide epimerase n=1 Tax=Sediminitomix flava TaxID=379075 RepID=A0A315ZCR6_SEDFL|nr:dipeptide epimerase [Sediminitomix flava]PWJ43341.1 L-alanine-DL-glutamate epimerase-like enolase superfamily enzyme [Sediminitomix flava]